MRAHLSFRVRLSKCCVTLYTILTRHDMGVTNVALAERHTVEFTADADFGIYPENSLYETLPWSTMV